MQRIVINKSIGGFSVSAKAFDRLVELENPKALDELEVIEELRETGDWDHYPLHGMDRSDPQLLQVIDELGSDAFGEDCTIMVVEIPDDVEWYIFENEMGVESIHEKHRVWP